VDPRQGKYGHDPVAQGPRFTTDGAGSAVGVDQSDGRVSRIDPASNKWWLLSPCMFARAGNLFLRRVYRVTMDGKSGNAH